MPENTKEERDRYEERLSVRVGMLEQKTTEAVVTLQYVSENLKRLETLVSQTSLDLNNWVKIQVNVAKSLREEQRMDVKTAKDEATYDVKLAKEEHHRDTEEKNEKMLVDIDKKFVAMNGKTTNRLEGQNRNLTLWVATAATIAMLVGIVIGMYA